MTTYKTKHGAERAALRRAIAENRPMVVYQDPLSLAVIVRALPRMNTKKKRGYRKLGITIWSESAGWKMQWTKDVRRKGIRR